MSERIRFPKEAWILLLAGLCWLWMAPDHGLIFRLMATIPGCLLLGSGVALLLWPGDPRMTHFAGLGALLGSLVAFPALFVSGFWPRFFMFGWRRRFSFHNVPIRPRCPGAKAAMRLST